MKKEVTMNELQAKQFKDEVQKERNALQEIFHKLSGARKDINMLLALEAERCEGTVDMEFVNVSFFSSSNQGANLKLYPNA